MNNKPVAWMSVELNGRTVLATYEFETAIPLYTHPVNPYQSITNTKIEPTVVSYTHPVKELTDEEIEEFEHLIAKAFDFSTQIKVVGLDRIIRAILRKAK